MDLLFQVVKNFLFFSDEELKAAFNVQNWEDFVLLLTSHYQHLQFAYFSARGGEVAIVGKLFALNYLKTLPQNDLKFNMATVLKKSPLVE